MVFRKKPNSPPSPHSTPSLYNMHESAVLCVSHIKTLEQTNRHDHRWHRADAELWLPDTASFLKQIVTLWYCVCVCACTTSPMNSRGVEQHKGSNCSCLWTPPTVNRGGCCGCCTQPGKRKKEKEPPIHHLQQVSPRRWRPPPQSEPAGCCERTHFLSAQLISPTTHTKTVVWRKTR